MGRKKASEAQVTVKIFSATVFVCKDHLVSENLAGELSVL